MHTSCVDKCLLVYTVLHGGQEHLKIETKLIKERFVSVMGVFVHSFIMSR